MLTALIISILSLASSYKQTSIDFKNDIKVNDKLDFFIIGDWGFKPLSSIISSNWDPHRQVADRMIELAEIYKPSMIINTGDNFYSGGLYQFSGEGVKGINDGRWKDFWSDVYLRDSMKNVPFFSVLGNHDWIGNVDSQIEYSNKKINPMWVLPDFFVYLYLPSGKLQSNYQNLSVRAIKSVYLKLHSSLSTQIIFNMDILTPSFKLYSSGRNSRHIIGLMIQ